jgi:glycosyltransferase involved in cell wall biosynthesis
MLTERSYVKFNGRIVASVIVPTRNRADQLSVALLSLVRQTYPAGYFEVLVVDNGSSDHTRACVESVRADNPHHKIKYLLEPVPGLLAGRHRGALNAEGRVLIFVDDDIEACKDWLAAMMETFEDDSVQIAGGPSLPKFECEPPQWLAKYWVANNGRMICGPLSLLYLGDETIEIDPTYVWGLNFAIKKKSLFELGGFHPDCIPKKLQHFQGDGETGLTLKLRAKGLKAVYAPRAKVYHTISRERLTVEYFENRFYYQGVCDSFSQIRRSRGISKASSNAMRYPPDQNPIDQNQTTQSAYERYKQIIYDRIQKAYGDGFLFHQTAVKKNRTLLKWVLRDNYLDYNLPNL